MKAISVLIVGQGGEDSLKELELGPGSTTRDCLEALGLPPSYLLSRVAKPFPFSQDQDLHAALQTGEKLRAVPQCKVSART